jgi:hypothetical protein
MKKKKQHGKRESPELSGISPREGRAMCTSLVAITIHQNNQGDVMHESNEQNKQVRAGIYARSAMKNPSAITRQIANCRQIAQERGWMIDDRCVYQDDGLGAHKTVGRHALRQLLAAVRKPACPINLLLIDDASRLGRDLRVIVEFLGALTRCGVRVYVAETKLELSGSTSAQHYAFGKYVRLKAGSNHFSKKIWERNQVNGQSDRY